MHSTWAITKNTLAQAVRMKVAVVVIVLLLILLPLMSVVMGGDGTPLGKLQTFVSYGLGLVGLLLSVLTIAIATFTLSNDLKRNYLSLIVTKPVRRYEIIVGKLLGLLLLNIVLLAVFGAIIYALTLAIPGIVDADAYERERIQAEFFTARSGQKVRYDDAELRRQAEERFRTLRQNDQIPRDMTQTQILSELIAQERMAVKACPPGHFKRWDFDGIRLKTNDDAYVFVRYKLEAAAELPEDRIYGTWQVGDLTQLDARVERPDAPVYFFERDDATRTFHEFAVPADAVNDAGYLGVAFFNNPALNRTTVILEEVEVLFDSGSFTGNYLRALLMIYVRLAFLAALGVSLTTWLSFPVAILASLVVFFIGSASGFILDSFESLEMAIGMLYHFTLRPLLWLIPRFDGDYSPSSYIISGRLIEWSFLATMIAVTLFVKATLAVLLGMWIFSRREIAKSVV